MMTRLMLALALAATVATPTAARAQWVTVYDQLYLAADHNWTFRTRYPQADRLFNAFDYGHAILYETLWARPGAPAGRLEQREFDYLTKTLLASPPRLPLVEEAIMPQYARLAPEAKAMFEWAHVLHRQVYDVLADERLSQAAKDREMRRLLDYYTARSGLAFSMRPKSMALMQEQPYSLAFRQKYPKFNGLIWGYHWLQVGLYEPLVTGASPEARQAGVSAAVTRFRQMLVGAPERLPHQMPMTAVVAPQFAARYPEVAIIFDNLHSMHDVISDILANPQVPRSRKRAEILLAARRFRDDTTEVMPVEAWRTMSRHMGAENMGGSADSLVGLPPRPTVTRGAVMRHDRQTGEMIGFGWGGAIPGAAGAHQHGAAPPDSTRRDSAAAPAAHDQCAMPAAPAADSLRPAPRDTAATPAAVRTPAARPPAKPARRPATRPAPKPAPRPAPKPSAPDPHAGHGQRPPAAGGGA